MSPEAQRIAIAEACGWSGPYVSREWSYSTGYEGQDEYLHDVATSPDGERCELPDYTRCLNAMHEAEKVLTKFQRNVYISRIGDVLIESLDNELLIGGFDYIHITAAQRAEAFLKTIGKWQPTADASSTERLG